MFSLKTLLSSLLLSCLTVVRALPTGSSSATETEFSFPILTSTAQKEAHFPSTELAFKFSEWSGFNGIGGHRPTTVPTENPREAETDEFDALLQIIIGRRNCQTTVEDYYFLWTKIPPTEEFVKSVIKQKEIMCVVKEEAREWSLKNPALIAQFQNQAVKRHITDSMITITAKQYRDRAGSMAMPPNMKERLEILNYARQLPSGPGFGLDLFAFLSTLTKDPVQKILFYDYYMTIKDELEPLTGTLASERGSGRQALPMTAEGSWIAQAAQNPDQHARFFGGRLGMDHGDVMPMVIPFHSK